LIACLVLFAPLRSQADPPAAPPSCADQATSLELATPGERDVDSEAPSGTINGSNDTFTLANTPASGSLHLYKNGIRQRAGGGNDYTLSTATITFEAGNIPQTGDILLADYRF
jgi:hypothetical protein